MRVYEAKMVYSLISLGEEVRLDKPDKVADYLRSAFDENPMQEAFYCVYLDRKNHPLGRHLITLGTATSTLVSPKEVFRGAILSGATAIVVSKQHSGADGRSRETSGSPLERSDAMKPTPDFSPLCQSFFAKRLIAQRRASPHTVAAYAQTFRLLTKFAQRRLATPPAKLTLAQLDAPFLASFLDDLESGRSNAARSRNARLAALRSFYHYAALEAPEHAGLIQRVLAVPYKRVSRPLVAYLTREEVGALLASVDQGSWLGRRNHAILLLAIQTGLRLSELTGLRGGLRSSSISNINSDLSS